MGVPAVLEEERRANQLRESPIYKEARERFDRVARDQAKAKVQAEQSVTINDEICAIEADARLLKPTKRALEPSVSYVFKCRTCGSDLPRGCPSHATTRLSPLTYEFVTERPFPCPSCKNSPWDEPERQGAPDVHNAFKPYWEISLGKDARCPKGVTYVRGKGHRINTAQQLREFARMNGREYR